MNRDEEKLQTFSTQAALDFNRKTEWICYITNSKSSVHYRIAIPQYQNVQLDIAQPHFTLSACHTQHVLLKYQTSSGWNFKAPCIEFAEIERA